MKSCFLVFVCLVAQACAAQKVAITFDDLPLNGGLPAGVMRVQIARDVVALLKARHLPAAYGFINAKKLEGNPDAAEALKIWAADEPVGNHTYRHMNLNQNAPEAFEREIDQNEPALELLAEKMRTGIGCAIRFCTKETLSKSGAQCGPTCKRMDIASRRSRSIGKITCGTARMHDA
jgi:Polysaccharide deacetylase